jgi:hypothetical protein
VSKHRPPSTPLEVKLLAWLIALIVVLWTIAQFTTAL